MKTRHDVMKCNYADKYRLQVAIKRSERKAKQMKVFVNLCNFDAKSWASDALNRRRVADTHFDPSSKLAVEGLNLLRFQFIPGAI